MDEREVLKILEAVKQISDDLRSKPSSDSVYGNSIKVLLQLQTQSKSVLSTNPNLSSVSQHLSELNDLIQQGQDSKPRHGIRSFVSRRVRSHEISRIARLIESELEAWIDRGTVLNLAKTIEEIHYSRASIFSFSVEEILLKKMDVFRDTLSRGFSIKLQDLLLKSGIFSELEWVLCKPIFSKRVREKAAIAMKELVLFNKDVFVGLVIVGQTVKSLLSMDSLCSLQVLSSLITAIRSPLVDELETSGGISKIVSLLESEDFETQMMAMDCVLEIGYFGRKDAVQAILNADIIKKLVELQRSEMGGARNRKHLENHPFESCVVRFTVQLEMGEGLRQREKRAFKQEILKKVKETCACDAEAATIVAEVLWGTSP